MGMKKIGLVGAGAACVWLLATGTWAGSAHEAGTAALASQAAYAGGADAGREVRAAADSANGAAPDGTPAFVNILGISNAWALMTKDVTGTIAIVDTGVDLKNPALAPYLTGGVNLLDTRKAPQDDNGHGTAVAGIIAAIADASKSPQSRVAWRMKLMPIKALDKNGEGDEADLTRGIRYAVEHGADIVVLSLGMRRDSPEMRDAVALAESKGVLLVAAGGNDAADFGAKAAVQYPAAYPTVLAVAGSNGAAAESRSTSGSEIDVTGVWKVQTLKLGGGATTMEGTSMSAPQVAGIAAMALAQHPGYTPLQLRELLRRTALDIAAAGWDRNTGYGRARAHRAVSDTGATDWREPNDSRDAASAFPLNSEVSAVWSSSGDVDMYIINVPYDGELAINWSIDDPNYTAAGKSVAPNLQLYGLNSSKALDPFIRSKSMTGWPVTKGKYYLRTAKGDWGGDKPSAYRLESGLTMNADPMEPNQTPLTAFTLAPRSQRWVGTFHRVDDDDWSVVTLPRAGRLSIKVDTDTTRIDPAIFVQRAGEQGTETDAYGDGRSEEVLLANAAAGKYYIRIRNAVSDTPEPVIGTYTVQFEYSTPYDDPGEPNNGPLSATAISLQPGSTREGLIDPLGDTDWYRFTLGESKLVRLQLSNLPLAAKATVKVYDKKLNVLGTFAGVAGRTTLSGSKQLAAGTYYVTVEANGTVANSYYRLNVQAENPAPVFSDVSGHWAEKAIRDVVEVGWMGGYAEGRFRPNGWLTRAEATAAAVRAFKPKAASGGAAYADVSKSYWAYDAIARAKAANWLSDFASVSFQPDQKMTRGEAAILFAKAAGLTLSRTPKATFADVPSGHPAAAALEALSRKGWVTGFADRTYRPEQPLTRAEWAVMLAQLL